MKSKDSETDVEESERGDIAKRIVAEAKAKAAKAAELLAQEMREEEKPKQVPLIEMRGTPQPAIVKWLMPAPKTIEEASSKKSGHNLFKGVFGKEFLRFEGVRILDAPLNEKPEYRKIGEDIGLAGLIKIVNEAFRRAVRSRLLKRTARGGTPLIQDTVPQTGDFGWRWADWRNPPLARVMTAPQVPLQDAPDTPYGVIKTWSGMVGSLIKWTEEVPGLANFFIANTRQIPLREERRSRGLFTQGNGIPFQVFRNFGKEHLSAISEKDGATPTLRSRIHDTLFGMSARRGEYEQARGSIEEWMYEAAKGMKKEEKEELLAEVKKVERDVLEIKDTLRQIKNKGAEPTLREIEHPNSDLTTKAKELESAEDEL